MKTSKDTALILLASFIVIFTSLFIYFIIFWYPGFSLGFIKWTLTTHIIAIGVPSFIWSIYYLDENR